MIFLTFWVHWLIAEDPEENWTVFLNAVHSSAVDTLGHTSRKHQDWFDENDEEIQDLLEDKHRLHKAHQAGTSSVSKKAAYNNICKPFQSRRHAGFLAEREGGGNPVLCR